MAVVTRYFGSSSAGAADGTTWADRAAFVSAGEINTIISAFDFTSDTLIARVGPGTHTLTTGIATFTGTATPSITFPCILEGALSDGTRWQPPDPDWCSAQPAWDAADATYPMPVIGTTTNIPTLNNSFVQIYGLKLTSSGRTGGAIVQQFRTINWCQIINSANGVNASACATGVLSCTNTYMECSGASYAAVSTIECAFHDNIRYQGNASASSGNRRGYSTTNNVTYTMVQVTACDNVGGGIVYTSTGNQARLSLFNCVIADNSGDGCSQAGVSATHGVIQQCMITGAHTNGINVTGTGDAVVIGCRIRDYTTDDIAGTLDWNDPPLNGNVNSAGTDADEYVDAASGDYRIKNTSSYWGKGIGAGDEPASGGGGGGGPLVGGRLVR